MRTPHILIVDQNPGAAESIRQALVPVGFIPVVDIVASREAFAQALTRLQPGVESGTSAEQLSA